MKYLLFLNCNSGCKNAPQSYVGKYIARVI